VVVVSIVVVVGKRWWCSGQIGIGDDDGAVVVVFLHCGRSLNRSLMMVLTCFSPFPYPFFFRNTHMVFIIIFN